MCVTGILQSEADGLQVLLYNRTDGSTLRLDVGDTFRIGRTEATIVHIGTAEIEIEIGGRRQRIAVGEDLDGGAN